MFLHDFSISTGLKINFQKSNLIPINVADGKAAELANIFGCFVGSLPFTYLGLPLGTTKPTMTGLMPLVDRVERRISSITTLMCHGQKITLINSLISSMVTFASRTFELPVKFIETFDKIRRRCLWTKKTEQGESCNSLIGWKGVCCPKANGGLGVIDIKVHNQSLLLKFLDKFYNHDDL